MKRIFEIRDAIDLQTQIVALIRHMESNHRDHRRLLRTKGEAREYDAIIGILSGLGDAIEGAELVIEERKMGCAAVSKRGAERD